MMLTVPVLSLASLSVEVLELVFTTVTTLRMLVLHVQVHVQSANGLEKLSSTLHMISLFEEGNLLKQAGSVAL